MDLQKIRSELETYKKRLEIIKSELDKYYFKSKISYDLVILDDIFPLLLSAFRIAEYNSYLNIFPKSLVLSTGTTIQNIDPNLSFAGVASEYESLYPQFKGRVRKFDDRISINAKLIYTVFINNIFYFINFIEINNIPFVFTLYPGGGFHIDEEAANQKLIRVFSSPNFRKVIVTQKNSYEYLIDKRFCKPNQIEFIYGGVLPSDRLNNYSSTKKYYKQNKNTFDICFVANKYQPTGMVKGYDIFIEVAKQLATQHNDFRFHIVGGHQRNDIDVSLLENHIFFYGRRNTDFFPSFYSSMDLILSPNRPAYLPGAFDGFPTGCCVEAVLCGVALFCTDCLNLNIIFKDREEIVLISLNVPEICEIIEDYYYNYDRLCKLAQKGQEAFKKIFDIKSQIEPRLKIIQEILKTP